MTNIINPSTKQPFATMADAVAYFQAENAALKKVQANGPKLSLKIAAKGGLSLYGMGRWPVTLYKEQWLKLIAFVKEIEKFIAENDALLKAKGDATAEVTATA